MPRKGPSHAVADDDYEDYDDDYDDYGDDYDDVDDYAVSPQPQAAASKAGGSSAAKGGGRHDKAVTAAAAGSNTAKRTFPVSPTAANAAAAAAAASTSVASSSTITLPRGAFCFDMPSPDDDVEAAQQAAPIVRVVKVNNAAQASKARSNTAQQNGHLRPTTSSAAAAAAAAAEELGHLHVERRRPLSQYTPEEDLQKACAAAQQAAQRSGAKGKLHLVVLGHVDAGKSTLMGRLLHELGVVSQKEVHKNEKEAARIGKSSFSWAWLLDERAEERARGVTVDVAVARFETQKWNVTLLDAPGHCDFVPAMIMGAAQADAAFLLVDGSPGGFEAGFEVGQAGFGGVGGGQTREHAQLAKSLGVNQMAVIVSKLDTCEYSQERFEQIKARLEPFLRQCGFKDSSVQWLLACGPTATNLTKQPSDEPLLHWWSGPTVVDAINAFVPPVRNTSMPLRIPIADVFKKRTLGPAACGGKVEGGAAKVGTRVAIVPGGAIGAIKALEVDGKSADLAMAGDSVDVGISGLDAAMLAPGAVVCHPDFVVPLVSRFEAQVVVVNASVPILQGASVVVHAHTAKEAGRVSGLLSLLNAKTGEVTKTKPRCLLNNQTAVIEVFLDSPMCLELYSDYKPLGRVALRQGTRTVAVGIVTKLVEMLN